MGKFIGIVIAAVIAISILLGSVFTIDQREQALVLQFGKVVRVEREPGLKYKIPFVQTVYYYDKRILDLDPLPFQVLLTDRKRIVVDAFARYRILDPQVYYERIRTNERLQDQFGKNLNASMQRILATVSLTGLLSQQRQQIMSQIQNDITGQGQSFGIEVLDVRIGRTDLPPEARGAVYERMKAERNREANELRAQGEEASLKIRSEAEKESTIILSEARKQADGLKGEGESERNRLLSEVYNRDPDFFVFYKSMLEYEAALAEGDTSLVISPNSEFFEFFAND